MRALHCWLAIHVTLLRNNYGSPVPLGPAWRSAALPTWWEFVQYLIHTPPGR